MTQKKKNTVKQWLIIVMSFVMIITATCTPFTVVEATMLDTDETILIEEVVSDPDAQSTPVEEVVSDPDAQSTPVEEVMSDPNVQSTTAEEVVSDPDVQSTTIMRTFSMDINEAPPMEEIAEVTDAAWYVETNLDWVLQDEHGTAYYADTDFHTTIERETINLTYALEINTQVDSFDVGDIKVRLPYFFEGLNTTDKYKPTSITVPQAPEINPNYSFNYNLEKTGDTTEIVFTNIANIEGAFNQVLQVSYAIPAQYFFDTQTYSLDADLTWVSNEHEAGGTATTAPITYTIDTGLDMTGAYVSGNINGTQNGGCLYAWSNRYGTEPADFDPEKYNYVVYSTSDNTTANQAYNTDLDITIDNGGKIVYFNSSNNSYKMNPKDPSSTEIETNSTTYHYQSSVSNRVSFYKYYNFVVAYPRLDATDENYVENPVYTVDVAYDAKVTDPTVDGVEIDLNDTDSATDSLEFTWQDYDFNYTGNLYEFRKSLYSNSNNLTVFEAEESILLSGYMSGTINGYNLNDYQFELMDDGMYWDFNSHYRTNTKMDSEEYRFIADVSDPGNIHINGDTTNRINGIESKQTLDDNEWFILYGRKDNDPWEEIQKFKAAWSTPVSWNRDKNYTALKIVSPKGLKDEWTVSLSFDIEVYNSDDYKALKAENEKKETPYKNLTLVNAANLQLYTDADEDSSTDYTWYNLQAPDNSTYDAIDNLYKEDLDTYGDEVLRTGASLDLAPVTKTGTLKKSCERIINDTVAGKVTAEFEMAVATQYNSSVPESIQNTIAMNDGVFYDLLPYGFTYDADSVNIHDINWNLCNTAVKLTDNYDGTGRQMVEFHVTTTDNYRPNGFTFVTFHHGFNRDIEYNNVASAFSVSYTASVNYMYLDYIPKTSYNLVAFQTADGKELPAGSSEDINYYPFKDVKGVDNNSAFYDVNGNGTIGDNNTYYSYDNVTVDVNTTIENGIRKRVKVKDGSYGLTGKSPLAEDYSYAIILGTTSDGTTKDVILYDVLEEAYEDGGMEGTDYWQGSFKGVDTTIPQMLGIAPVIYYATADNLDVHNQEQMNITKTDIWSTTCPTNPADVTAVAFDLTTNKNGEPHVFDGYHSLMVEVFMTAPSHTSNAIYAYNEPAFSSTYRGNGTSAVWTPKHNVGQPVTVEIVDLQEFSFTKYGAIENGTDKILKDVTFELYLGDDLVSTSVSDKNGIVSFTNLESGDYTLKETALPYDEYNLEDGHWTFTVNHNTGTITDPVASDDTIGFTGNATTGWKLTNKEATIDIAVNKVWKHSLADLQPENVQYTLYQNDKKLKTITTTATDYSYTFTDLKQYDGTGAEYNYTVQEEPIPGYTTTSTSIANKSFTFTNTMDSILQLNKDVEDGKTEDANKTFEFTITLADTTRNGTYACDTITTGSTAVSFDETITFTNGKATFSLKADQSIVIGGLPIGSCTIKEKEELYYSTTHATANVDTIAYDMSEHASHYDGSTVNTKITQSTLTRVQFVNTYQAGSLKVDKTVYGNASDSSYEFQFEVIFTGPGSNQEYIGTLKHDDGTPTEKITTINGNATFKLDEGDVLVFDDLPYDLKYEILQEEVDGDGYIQTHLNNHDGVIEGDEEEHFKNYASTVDVHLSVIKKVIGDTPPSDQAFKFVLTPTTSGTTETAETITIKGDGTGSFTNLAFNSEDHLNKTYTYTITEKKETVTGYTYDASVYDISIAITKDSNDILIATTTYKKGGTHVENIQFSNEYDSGFLTIEKAVTGTFTKETNRDFTFTVTFNGDDDKTYHYKDTDNTIGFITGSGTIKLKADQSITFTDLPLGTRYTVVEENYSLDGYTTTKEGDTGIIDSDGNIATFTNNKDTQTATTSIPVKKEIEAIINPSASSDFKFQLAEITDGQNTEIETITIHGEGEGNFTDITYKDADIGTHVYQVTEVDTGITGYIYDKTVYNINVVVSYDVNATLQAIATYTDEKKQTITLPFTFTNQYKASDLLITKNVMGNLGKTTDSFNFTLTFSDKHSDNFYEYIIHRTGASQGEHHHMTTTATFSLAHGDWVEFRELPAGMAYEVVETDYLADGYVTTSKNASGTLKDGENKVVFYNAKNSSTITVPITAQKEIKGSVPPKNCTFTFQLTATTDSTFMPDSATDGIVTVSLDGDGLVDFGNFIYGNEEVGTHLYTLTEQAGTASGYSYDDTTYELKIDISYKSDGTLQAIPTYTKGEEVIDAAELIFVNTYTSGNKGRIVANETQIVVYPNATTTSQTGPIVVATGDQAIPLFYLLCSILSLYLIVQLLIPKKSRK